MSQQVICRYCGLKVSSPYGGSCSHSPHKNHEWTPALPQHFCRYCGLKVASPYGGSCSRSPHKKHEWS